MTPILVPNSDPDRVRVATYARQSHKNETDSQASPLAQRQSGEAYTASQPGWAHVAHYEDVGISGFDPDAYRPGYEEMMEDVRAGKLDVIVVLALSRLTRKGVMDALVIRTELDEYGVGLVSVTEPFINTSHDNPFSVAFFALIAALAHQESKNKSEFIRRSFAQIRERGGHISGSAPWWAEAEEVTADKVTIRRLKPDEEMRPLALRIIEMGESGMTYTRIASALTEENTPTPAALSKHLAGQRNQGLSLRKGGDSDSGPAEWSASVVLRFLKDPRIGGFAVEATNRHKASHTILRDDNGDPVAPHVGLIPPERWYALQEVLQGRKREMAPQREGTRTLLGTWGLLRCGTCGSSMTVSRGSTPAYVCNLGRTVGDAPRHKIRVPMADTDDIVARALWTRLPALDPATNDSDAELLAEATRRYAHNNANAAVEADRLAVQAQLDHVRGTLEQLYADRADGLYAGSTGRAMFAKQAQQLTAHEESCTTRLEALNEAAHTSATIPLNDWAGDTDEDPLGPGSPWGMWSVEERRGFAAIWLDAVHVLPSGPQSGWGPKGDIYGRTRRRVRFTWASRASGSQQ